MNRNEPSPKGVERLEQALDITFQDKRLLALALVHGSYVNEHPNEGIESNERLEFLGDAVLDVIVGEAVYRWFPAAPEGQLTVLRAAVVRDECLARVSSKLGVGALLMFGQGEEATGGRARPSNLAAALEALIGAAFLDQGYAVARKMVLHLLADEMSMLSAERVPVDAKSQLQGLAQQQGRPGPVYRVVHEQGPEHAKEFEVEVVVDGEVLGTGRGRRKAEAEREAAVQAIAALNGARSRE
ncbi:MAG: ribonuclease III [Dehalococcoidia bacterium]|nr:ribonuclease III [Dehalococcoidia bacterium]